ncbi:MAG: lipid-A-disaccharide synthase [Gammaproteobacteria bacterium]|jgi:lipid-A-disaccharide synthase|nr:lipid-A-disaccharide synthase [Gammaproteobacteria bacterium]
MPRIAIVVGEASGDQLARGLMDAIRLRLPDAEFVGITGPRMRAAGCTSWGDYEQLALMGLVEIIRHVPRLLSLLRELRKRLEAEQPDLYIGIDAPDFNLRLAPHARRLGIPTVQYVCPSVWAWRQGRVKGIRRACSHVLCLLPFEQAFLEANGVPATFVGHPLADEIAQPADQAAAREGLGLSKGRIVALLPGSRMGEVEYLGPVFLDAVVWLLEQDPQLSFVVAAASARIARVLAEQAGLRGLGDVIDIREGVTREVVAAADAVLLASGTATLETMLLGRPMVVAYKVNPVTAWLARRLVKTEFAALPNLLAGSALVPEYLQEAAVGADLGAAVLRWLDSEQETASLLRQFAELGAALRRGASARAAEAVIEVMAAGSLPGGKAGAGG